MADRKGSMARRGRSLIQGRRKKSGCGQVEVSPVAARTKPALSGNVNNEYTLLYSTSHLQQHLPLPRSFTMDVLQNSIVAPLQPLLRPIVDAIPEPVHDAVISLIGSPCHSALLLDLDLTKDPACTSLAISKALGIAIVGASAVVKVPQILKLISSRSSAGVSFVSYALETASLLITLSYGVRNQFPFSTYGESALIAIQDVAVGVLVLTFAGRSAAAATFVAVVAAAVYALLFDQTLVDAQTMSYLQAGAGILGVASKAPQIYTIWSQGGTGQLSAFAVCLRRFVPAKLQK